MVREVRGCSNAAFCPSREIPDSYILIGRI